MDRTQEERRRMGVVYFIMDGEYTTIGYTFHLKQRLAELQQSSAKKLRVSMFFMTSYTSDIETILHNTYKADRVNSLCNICATHAAQLNQQDQYCNPELQAYHADGQLPKDISKVSYIQPLKK
jgi:hypothetical protein